MGGPGRTGEGRTYAATFIERRKPVLRTPEAEACGGGIRISRQGRHFAVQHSRGDLVCLAGYRCGAREVARRLGESRPSGYSAGPAPWSQGRIGTWTGWSDPQSVPALAMVQ